MRLSSSADQSGLLHLDWGNLFQIMTRIVTGLVTLLVKKKKLVSYASHYDTATTIFIKVVDMV